MDRTLLPAFESLAVLVSGGLDSAILVGEAIQTVPRVCPLYVRSGLIWENTEREYLTRFLAALDSARVQPLHVLEMPVQDVYGAHWSTTGEGVPDEKSPDAAVFLPGRNVFLLAKAFVWCALHGVEAVALASLAGNPFPDATPSFFRNFGAIVNQALEANVQVVLPYRAMHKAEVLQRGRGLPLEWTFSCIRPVHGLHCGRCNKCAERQAGFRAANLPDNTKYNEVG